MTKKVLKQYEFGFVEDCTIRSISLLPGRYLFQGWGASGGGIGQSYGNGSYTEGELILSYQTTFYISVGGQGKDPINENGAEISCGGGGAGGKGARYHGNLTSGGYGGGGSTDVRMERDDISSRILVAAGGGGESGNSLHIGKGGNGGDITSEPISCYSENFSSAGASQYSGYSLFNGENGRDGIDETGSGSEGNGGGGGGYYGGNSTRSTEMFSSCGGAGGSSYISGHPLCTPNYYTFRNIVIEDGSNTTIKPHKGSNPRDGFLLISLLEYYHTQQIIPFHSFNFFVISITFTVVVKS